MKLILKWSLLFFLGFILSNCNVDPQEEIVGDWEAGSFFVDGVGTSGTVTSLAFNSDGTLSRNFSVTVNNSLTYSINDEAIYLIVNDEILVNGGGSSETSWRIVELKKNKLEFDFNLISGENLTFDLVRK